MFIHYRVFVQHPGSRHEWVMENEGIPVAEYELQARKFKPKPNFARDWAKLAESGRPEVHGDDYQASRRLLQLRQQAHRLLPPPKQGPGRDLVKEYVEAARAEGMRVGFYYSLMDWHHPDGARCATDEAARQRFVAYIHGQVRELLTNYGKVDILWYDVNWPLKPEGWEAEKLNDMVFQLQPEIIVNNRTGLPGDFATPEQRITADSRPWESCMTMNDSWGYQKADDNWKTSKTIVRNLVTCARDTGNYLLNIGPMADGVDSAGIHPHPDGGGQVDGEERPYDLSIGNRASRAAASSLPGSTSARCNTHCTRNVYYWPGDTIAIGGLMNKVKSAHLYAGNNEVKFAQDKVRLRLTGLPERAPDDPVTHVHRHRMADDVPRQDTDYIRKERPRTHA